MDKILKYQIGVKTYVRPIRSILLCPFNCGEDDELCTHIDLIECKPENCPLEINIYGKLPIAGKEMD
jgi:hypothetical protein